MGHCYGRPIYISTWTAHVVLFKPKHLDKITTVAYNAWTSSTKSSSDLLFVQPQVLYPRSAATHRWRWAVWTLRSETGPARWAVSYARAPSQTLHQNRNPLGLCCRRCYVYYPVWFLKIYNKQKSKLRDKQV